MYEAQRHRADIDDVREYTDQIGQMVQSECPSLSVQQAYDIAADLRDQHLKGNTQWCAEYTGVPLTQGQTASCLAGPPQGYPRLSDAEATIRELARMSCR